MLCTTPVPFFSLLLSLLLIKILCIYLLVNFFLEKKNIIWPVNPHIPHQKKQIAPCVPVIVWKVKHPLHFVFSYAPIAICHTAEWIINCLKRTFATKVTIMKITDNFIGIMPLTPGILLSQKNEVSIVLHFQLRSTCYEALYNSKTVIKATLQWK